MGKLSMGDLNRAGKKCSEGLYLGTTKNEFTRSILDGYFSPLVFWYGNIYVHQLRNYNLLQAICLIGND